MNLLNESALIELIDMRIKEVQVPTESQASTWWDIEDLKKEVKKGNKWCIDMLNYPPFKKELMEKQIVFYPEHNRQGYSMLAEKMKDWLLDNHYRIRSSTKLFRTN